MNRTVEVVSAPGAGEQDPLLAGAVREVERKRVDKDGNVIGLSGLREAMQRATEGGVAAGAAEAAGPVTGGDDAGWTEAPPEARVPHAGSERARQMARLRAARRRSQTVYLLAAAAVLLLLVLGGGIWLVRRPGPHRTAAGPTAPAVAGAETGRTSGAAGARSAQAGSLSDDVSVPILPADALRPDPWTRPDEPYQFRLEEEPVAWLTKEHMSLTPDGQQVLAATVVTDHAGIIAAATVHLSLVDGYGVEVARTKVPVALLDRYHPQVIRLRVPSDLRGASLRPASWVEVTDTLEGGVYFQEVLVEPFQQGQQRGLQLLAFNPSSQTLRRVLFLITAVDARGRPLARWLAEWDGPVEGLQRVECQVLINSDPTPAGGRWQVEAAGK